MDELQACVVAANTIKQYARFYLYRKRCRSCITIIDTIRLHIHTNDAYYSETCRQERDLAAQWEENISNSRSNSRNPSLAGMFHVIE
jgi:hypothetical protein